MSQNLLKRLFVNHTYKVSEDTSADIQEIARSLREINTHLEAIVKVQVENEEMEHHRWLKDREAIRDLALMVMSGVTKVFDKRYPNAQ